VAIYVGSSDDTCVFVLSLNRLRSGKSSLADDEREDRKRKSDT
jgi:hypothetical protein